MRTVWVCAARLLLWTKLQQSQQHSSSVSGQGNDWWTHTSGTFPLTFLPIGDIQLEVCAFSQAYRCTQLEKWLLLTILLINPMIRSKTYLTNTKHPVLCLCCSLYRCYKIIWGILLIIHVIKTKAEHLPHIWGHGRHKLPIFWKRATEDREGLLGEEVFLPIYTYNVKEMWQIGWIINPWQKEDSLNNSSMAGIHCFS